MTELTSNAVYLRSDVVVEPLFARWYAWIMLISPAVAALNIAHRHIPVMTSYVSSPALHAAASKNPEMLGGQFISYEGDRVTEIEALLAWTHREQADLIELATAIQELHTLLRSQATGMAMDALYPYVPTLLQGFVELEYDLYGRPTFRLLESLLYRSHFYQERFQGLVLYLANGEERPFMLSTPRLDEPSTLHIETAFANEAVDALFKMKSMPARLDEIGERFNIDRKNAVWEQFFTSQPPPMATPFRFPGVRVRYFGHACLLIETEAVTMLIDPVVSYSMDTAPERFTFCDLPDRIDYVLITHHHQDHAQLETLLQLRHKIGTLVVAGNLYGALQDPSLRLMFHTLGFRHVVELGEMESITVPGGQILGLPFIGEHHDLAIRSRLGYRIDLLGHSLVVLVDACNLEPAVYERVCTHTGSVDILFLGMECVGSPLSWSYGSLLPDRPSRVHDQSRRGRGCNFVEGRALVEKLGVKTLYIYAMGQEPWLRHILGLAHAPDSPQIAESNRLIDWCRKHDIAAQRLYGKFEFLLK